MLKEAMSSPRSPDRKSVSTELSALSLVQNLESKLQYQNSEFLIKIQTSNVHNYKDLSLLLRSEIGNESITRQ